MVIIYGYRSGTWSLSSHLETFTRPDFVKAYGEEIRTLVEKEKAPKLASILGRFVMEAYP